MLFSMSHFLLIAQQTTLLPFGSPWKYLDNGTDQGTAWRTTTFDDAAWANGASPLGYGGDGEVTTVNYGADADNKYITTYFRKTISIANPSAFVSILGSVRRDDGVIIYVNGTEVYRNNLASGTVTYTTLASNATDEAVLQAFSFNPSVLVNGNNTIAAEIHQTSISSSDISFNLQLTGSADPSLIRGPYMNMVNQNAVTLRWRTDIPSNTKVEVGTIYGTYPTIFSNATASTEHEIRLTGLNPDTKYYYRFGSSTLIFQSGTDNYFVTAPPPTTTRKMRFAVFGDCGINIGNNQVQALASYQNYLGSHAGEIMILLGDNAYNSGLDDEYQSGFFTPYQSSILKNHVIMPAPGNHDYANSSTVQQLRTAPYYQNFTLPTAGECGGVASNTEGYYSWDRGDVHFISLDSYGTESANNYRLYDTLGPQVVWLKQDLAANTKKWTIAYWHHPPYTMGSHNSDTEGELINMRTNFIRILERYGVDLIMCGHSHDYERSYLLKGHYGDEASFDVNSHAVSSSSAKYDASPNSCPYNLPNGQVNHGTVYVVSGSSGASGGTQAGYPHNAFPWSFNAGGMLHIEIEGNRLDAKFLRADFVVADQFTIMKDVKKNNTVTIPSGSSTTLKASWIGNYAWNNTTATTQSITVTPTTNTTYIVTDNVSCLADTFNVKLQGFSVSLKVFLEGAYNGSTMRSDLANIMPLSDPYTALGFLHQNGGGGENTTRTNITANNIVDWVFVELTSNTTPTITYTQSALLKANGDIVGTDGVSSLTFSTAVVGSYFVNIKQRNHLRVKTNNVISLTVGVNTLNFTDGSISGGTTPMKSVTIGANIVYLMYSGDLNQDGDINATDRSNAWNARNLTGYNQNDCSMNGTVDATDRSNTWNNRNLSAGF